MYVLEQLILIPDRIGRHLFGYQHIGMGIQMYEGVILERQVL